MLEIRSTPPRHPIHDLLREGLDLVFPRPCLSCTERRAVDRLGLCLACRGRLRRLPAASCRRCGTRLDSRPLPSDLICGGCRIEPPPWERLYALWSYEPPADALVGGLKFRRLEYLADELAGRLAEELGTALQDFDLLAPVPLHWSRRWLRGFDQTAAIARSLARRTGLPCRLPLRRRRRTLPQSGLAHSERQANLVRAFVCPPRRRRQVAGRAVVLVDDVVTTGATLRAAALALRAAGARPVAALVVARTPFEGRIGRRT